MINCTEIKPGQCFTWENELYQCIDIQLNKTAMAKMKVKVKVKQPKTGVVKELSLISGDKVGEAYIDKRPMQFLYDGGDMMVFMDQETYEQIEIPKDKLEWESNFLVANLDVNIMIYENDIRDDNGNYFEFRTHRFRHTFGVKLTEMKLDDDSIARLLGHKDTRTIPHYRRLRNEALAEDTKAVRDEMNELLAQYRREKENAETR